MVQDSEDSDRNWVLESIKYNYNFLGNYYNYKICPKNK